MSWRSDSSQLFAGKWMSSLYAGLGIQAQNIPSTGESGASILYNDIAAQGAAPTDEFMAELLTAPAVGNFRLYEDGSFEFTGAPDGVDTFTYRGRRNGVVYGDYTVTINIGGFSSAVGYELAGFGYDVQANIAPPTGSAYVSYALPSFGYDVQAEQSTPFDAEVAYQIASFGYAITSAQTTPALEVDVSYQLPPFGYTIYATDQVINEAGDGAKVILARKSRTVYFKRPI